MAEDRAVTHLEALRIDVRDEIKRRIEQRDKYSIQLTIALGALVAIAFSRTDLAKVLIAAPLVSIYFTVLIMYSYSVHSVLALYLREELEPRLADLSGTPVDTEWERFYARHEVPGIRKGFFLAAVWVVSFGSLGYLWVAQSSGFLAVLVVTTVIYVAAAGFITVFFGTTNHALWQTIWKDLTK